MRHAGWLLVSTTVLAAGCGGSLRPAVLLASARAAYPDCDDVVIAEPADGVQQWMVVCGERRLFGLRPRIERLSGRTRRSMRSSKTAAVPSNGATRAVSTRWSIEGTDRGMACP